MLHKDLPVIPIMVFAITGFSCVVWEYLFSLNAIQKCFLIKLLTSPCTVFVSSLFTPAFIFVEIIILLNTTWNLQHEDINRSMRHIFWLIYILLVRMHLQWVRRLTGVSRKYLIKYLITQLNNTFIGGINNAPYAYRFSFTDVYFLSIYIYFFHLFISENKIQNDRQRSTFDLSSCVPAVWRLSYGKRRDVCMLCVLPNVAIK